MHRPAQNGRKAPGVSSSRGLARRGRSLRSLHARGRTTVLPSIFGRYRPPLGDSPRVTRTDDPPSPHKRSGGSLPPGAPPPSPCRRFSALAPPRPLWGPRPACRSALGDARLAGPAAAVVPSGDEASTGTDPAGARPRAERCSDVGVGPDTAVAEQRRQSGQSGVAARVPALARGERARASEASNL